MPCTESSPLLLASGSPRRRELLASVGIPLVVRAAVVDEAEREGEAPDAYLERVVGSKLAAARALAGSGFAAVLVADTIVVGDGRILGKPADRADAIRIVSRLAGKVHDVKTRFWVERLADGAHVTETVATRVHVRSLPDAWIERYADTKEGFDKAGAYAVQGRFAFAIERIEGSYTNVVGLPLCEVVRALDGLGLLYDFLRP